LSTDLSTIPVENHQTIKTNATARWACVEAITRQQVADRLDVPVVGIDGMIEAGELQYHEGPTAKYSSMPRTYKC
jgi:hypothetical protein